MSVETGTENETSSPHSPSMKGSPEERRVLGNVSYVIQGSKETHRVRYRNFAADILESPWFDNTIGFVITANAVTIGLESTAQLREWSSLDLILFLEHVWLAIYCLELGLRFFVVHLHCLKDNWVKFDCLLVVSSVATQWILQPAGWNVDALGPMMVLRMLRLLRLARTLKLIVTVRELWLLVRSLTDSASTIVYTMGLLLIILYVFACIGVELITFSPAARGENADPEFVALVEEYFPSLGVAMMTLVQFICFDSISGIYRPFVRLDPSPPILGLYFSLAFVFMGIVLMNLITAVVVNSALEQAGKDKEAMRIHAEKDRRTLVKGLRKMFARLDVDGSGNVTLLEVQCMNSKDREEIIDAAGVNNPDEIFEALDVDGNGLLSIDDFCDGMWKVSASQVPLEVKRTEKQVCAMRDTLKAMQQAQLEMQESIAQLQQHLLPASIKPAAGPRKDQSYAPVCEEAWVETLALRLQRSVQIGIRAALDTTSVDSANNEEAQIVQEAPILANGSAGKPDAQRPAWAGEMLLELQRLSRECAAVGRPPLFSVSRNTASRREGSLRAIAADVGRGACVELCRPSSDRERGQPEYTRQKEGGEVTFIGRRLHEGGESDDSSRGAQISDEQQVRVA